VLLHLPALSCGFVWDDRAQVLSNAWLRSWSSLPTIFGSGVWDFEAAGITNYYRPLMHVAYLALYQAFGPAAWAFHAANVVADAAAAVLVMRVAERLAAGGEGARVPWPALAAGLVFAAHPVHVEAVAWVACLSDVAGTALALAALLLHLGELRGGTARAARLAGAGALLLAALLLKETFVAVPLAALAAELWLARGEPLARRAARLAPYAAAGAVYLALRLAALGHVAPKVEAHGLGAGHAVAEAPALLGRYLLLLAAPFDLRVWHELPPAGSWLTPAGVAGLAAAAALVAAAALAARRAPAVAVGLVLAGAAILPALYTSAISGGRFAERYLYLPSAGAALAVSGALALAAGRPALLRASWAAVAVLVAAGGAATLARLPAWQDEASLWADAVRTDPGAALPHYNLGSALLERGRPAEAAAELERALALGVEPRVRAAALVNLGRIAEGAHRPEDALRRYRDAVAADPGSASARGNLGGALAEAGRLDEALEHLRAAVALRPNEADLRYNLGLVLSDLGRLAEARAELEAAARLAPGDPRIAATLRGLGGAAPGRGTR
jgi:tetratricopeptide (TPR) repeat protein